MVGLSSAPAMAGDLGTAPTGALGLGRGWESKWGGEEDSGDKKSLRGAMRETGEEVRVHRRDPAARQGRAQGAGTLGGHARP